MPEKQPVPKEQKVALAILGVIGLYMLYSNFFAPMSGNIARAEENLASKETELAEMRSRAAEIDVLKKELSLYEKLLSETEEKLPVTEELPEFIRAITSLASRYGMDMSVLTMVGVQQREFYNTHIYGMNLLSDYHNLARFFTELGQMERIMGIRNLALLPMGDDDGGGGLLLQANFELLAYTFKK